MRSCKIQGFIIARKNFSEADRIITIFTKEYGKIKVLGKGVRRITSRRAPHLELFSLSSIILVKGKNFDIVTSAETINPFINLKKDLSSIKKAYFITEIVDKLCPQNQSLSEVFVLLTKAFDLLDKKEKISLKEFAKSLVSSLGYLPKKKIPANFDIISFIEKIIERKLWTKKFIDN